MFGRDVLSSAEGGADQNTIYARDPDGQDVHFRGERSQVRSMVKLTEDSF